MAATDPPDEFANAPPSLGPGAFISLAILVGFLLLDAATGGLWQAPLDEHGSVIVNQESLGMVSSFECRTAVLAMSQNAEHLPGY